jgi:16S rRNA processing protein RimM
MKEDNIPSHYIVVGKVGSTYGIKGWLKILSFTDSVANIVNYNPWYLGDDLNGWTPVKVIDSREHGKGMIVLLEGLHNPEEARLVTGKTIAIQRSQLPPLEKHEYYWADLKGLTVINQAGDVLGKVIYLIETGSNDVIVVKGEKEHAIPYLPTVIKEIDLTTKTIHVNWDIS